MSMKKQWTFWILMGIIWTGTNCYCLSSKIPCVDLNRNINGQGPKIIVVDVRGTGNFNLSHIPTAINYSYEAIGKAKLSKE